MIELDDGTRRISQGRSGSGAELRRLIAIDIGRNGALALFVDNELVSIDDMPTLADGPAGRPTINGRLLASLIRRLVYLRGRLARRYR